MGVIGGFQSGFGFLCRHTLKSMAPKVIEDPDFKYREELPSDVIKKLLIDGGAEKVKEALTREWNYGPDEKVAVPVLVAGPDGKFSGAKWVITADLQIILALLGA